MTKTYFLAPTLDCPPSGPIALGSIITSPANPEIPLNPPLPIDHALMPISEKHEDNWKHEIQSIKWVESSMAKLPSNCCWDQRRR